MATSVNRLLGGFAAICMLCSSGTVLADRPTWIPIAELLVGSIGEADPVRMSDVMSRCSALNMTLAGLADSYSPEMSETYQNEALRLIQHGIMIESNMEKIRTGFEADIPTLSDVAVEKVKLLLEGYSLWLDDNISTSDSYFSKEFDMEIDSCRLASRMMNQMAAG
jgi:hypothetical protein